MDELPSVGIENKSRIVSRQDFLNLAYFLSLAGLSACVPKIISDMLATPAVGSNQSETGNLPNQVTKPELQKDIPIGPQLDVPDFTQVQEMRKFETNSSWNADQLQQQLQEAVKKSVEKNREIVVDLPKGETIIDRQITCTIPEGAKITLRGHTEGSRLKLHSSLSNVSKEWGSFAQKNMLYFKDMEGELTINGVEFHGGSERAGSGGYIAPASPWDAVVLIVGSGEGDKTDPAMHRIGKRKGKANVKFCGFYQSESEGIMMQNLKSAGMQNCWGRNLDVLFNASWCDSVSSRNVTGENFTSDGTYITSAQNVELSNWHIKTARQGYDLQGVANAVLNECHAYDCGYSYAISRSETDRKTWSGAITLNNCHSRDCQIVYALGLIERLQVNRANHDGIGKWYLKYLENDFLHKDGIRNPESIFAYNAPVLVYPTDGVYMKSGIYNDVKIRLSSLQKPEYKIHQFPGITYSREG
ncbi:hypothetical protein A2W14_02975 [Candidatus Gottesmanbacteria bacterium RBG_16_37_8]|uniref:Right handed beta helix domain-containing protein n=1 Tax=Candidatus Gottesmanbacteria bacterium RBG_16_37_8 TaxID=1798371 RepID=A0A1F5YU01_9BACT|nr:MAG: hypothetical protein A2W14_02975 [Candidatus Gottesmanbacteria bacterium RBG_16_37_8]